MNLKSNEKRCRLLKKIIAGDGDFYALSVEAGTFNWDFDGQPVILGSDAIKNMQERFLEGKVGAVFVSQWADFLELRDDVDYLQEEEALNSEIIYELANPDLHGGLGHDRAVELIAMLKQKEHDRFTKKN